jgi:hypothetical protein
MYFTFWNIFFTFDEIKIQNIMKKQLLLPQKFKIFGWLLLALSTLLWSIYVVFNEEYHMNTTVFSIVGSEGFLFGSDTKYFSFIKTDITNTLLGAMFIVGGFLVVFSKEKVEDEFITNLRLTSFQWAFFMNYAVLLFLFLFIYGIDFLNVLIYNMFTVMILYIARFHYLLFMNQRNFQNEEYD